MDSSPGFASAARDSSRPLKDSLSLRLASKLNLAAPQLAGSFYKRHAVTPSKGAPTACGRTVSGAVSLPSRGAFHLSLTVLVRYRSQESIQPWRVDPPASHRVSRVRRYSGTVRRASALRVRGSNPLRPAFPSGSARPSLCNRTGPGLAARNPGTPRLSAGRFGLFPLSLAATGGISFDFSSSGYLDVSVPRVAPSGPMCSARRRRASTARRVFPFGDPRVKGRVPLTADYRSLPRPSSASCAKASAVRPYHLPSISDGMVNT